MSQVPLILGWVIQGTPTFELVPFGTPPIDVCALWFSSTGEKFRLFSLFRNGLFSFISTCDKTLSLMLIFSTLGVGDFRKSITRFFEFLPDTEVDGR